VIAWGDNSCGQTAVPPGLTNVVAIRCGDSHALALTAADRLIAWGYNQSGQTDVPAGLTNILNVASGARFNLVQLGCAPPLFAQKTWLVNPQWASGAFRVPLPSQAGRVYCLEYKRTLTDANWTALPLVPGNGGTQTLTDSNASGGQRIYRVRCW
jgi:hypothetical protein